MINFDVRWWYQILKYNNNLIARELSEVGGWWSLMEVGERKPIFASICRQQHKHCSKR